MNPRSKVVPCMLPALSLLVATVVVAAEAVTEPRGGTVRGSSEQIRRRSGEPDDAERIERTGLAPRTGRIRRTPAPGWAGERRFGDGNDWEPAVAADPGAPFVYMVTTRYSGHPACSTCAFDPFIALEISSDGGQTFGPATHLCPCPGMRGGQYDPQIESAADGSLYATWISGNFRIVLSRSTDHGRTWTDPVVVSHGAGWGDHPWIAVSGSGQDVYIAFNHRDSWIAQSHDFGSTWDAPMKTNTQARYFYAGGGFVASDGAVTFAQANYPVGCYRRCSIRVVATRSTDGGATWQTRLVDVVRAQPPCQSAGCRPDYYGAHATLAGDANGDLVIAYDGARVRNGAQFVYVRRSSDAGARWSGRVRLSPPGRSIIAAFPAAAGAGDGDFRVWYMDDRNGPRGWNVWLRRSTDGGRSWSDDVRLSDATSGTSYKHPRGFDQPYGDYGEVAVTSAGGTFAIWGEGESYAGPGGTWYNRTR